VLTIYNRTTAAHTNYIPAPDRRLRESLQLDSPRLPAFYHPCDGRDERRRLNVFLVIINAGIKFRRYIQMTSTNPLVISLPTDVLTLMDRTNELVELLYWKPIPTKGSRGEMVFAPKLADNTSKRRKKFHWPAGMDVKARIAYSDALMGGNGLLHFLSVSPIVRTDCLRRLWL
jgi:hypothetical protein